MKLANCLYGTTRRLAIVRDDCLNLLGPQEHDIVALLQDSARAEAAITRRGVAFSEVTFLPPVARPDKIICVGINYRAHSGETTGAADDPKHPSVFVRFPGSQVGHGQPITAPSISPTYDFEGELAFVIGKPAWRVPRGQALDYVAGYSCFAENSVREFQKHGAQVTAGKNFRGSGAFGPWLTSADEVGDPQDLILTTRLNGEVVQNASLSTLIFPVDALVEYISSFTELLPGDVVATGTPAGVGGLRTPPLWMKPGDVLEVDIPKVGLLRNVVEAESFPRSNI